MTKSHSITGIRYPLLLLIFLSGCCSLVFAEHDAFKPYLSNSEINKLWVTEPKINYGLSLKGNLSGKYDQGIYQLQIDDINVGWKGANIVSDLKLIFSFSSASDDPGRVDYSINSETGIDRLKADMRKQNGLFYMSIGKSW